MSKFFRLIGMLGLILLIVVAATLITQIEDWSRDLSVNFAALDDESNDPRMRPPLLDLPRDAVAQRITTWAEQAPRWTVQSQDVGDDQTRIHLTRATRLFGWVDDIHVTLGESDGLIRLDAESRSRIGKGDLGQNPRNLRELLDGTGLSATTD